MQNLTKASDEREPLEFDFADELPLGESLVSGTVNAVNLATGLVDNTILGSTAATISGTAGRYVIQGGVDGDSYEISLIVTTTPSGYKYRTNATLTIDDHA